MKKSMTTVNLALSTKRSQREGAKKSASTAIRKAISGKADKKSSEKPAPRSASLSQVIEERLGPLTNPKSTKQPRTSLTDQERSLLQAGGFDLEQRALADDPVERAAALYKKILTESYTVEKAAQILGVNDSRIRQRLSAHTLYGIKIDGEWRIPSFQFEGNVLIPGIGSVVAQLPTDLNPVSVWKWFTSKHTDLFADMEEKVQLSPLEWLRTGHSTDTLGELAREL